MRCDGVSPLGLPDLSTKPWNSAPRALSSTGAGIGVALSPLTESTTTRIDLPPALSARDTVTKLVVLKAMLLLGPAGSGRVDLLGERLVDPVFRGSRCQPQGRKHQAGGESEVTGVQ